MRNETIRSKLGRTTYTHSQFPTWHSPLKDEPAHFRSVELVWRPIRWKEILLITVKLLISQWDWPIKHVSSGMQRYSLMLRNGQVKLPCSQHSIFCIFFPFWKTKEQTNEQQKCMLLISLFLVDETLECTTNNENRLNNFNNHILFPSSKPPILRRIKHKSYSCNFPLPEKKTKTFYFISLVSLNWNISEDISAQCLFIIFLTHRVSKVTEPHYLAIFDTNIRPLQMFLILIQGSPFIELSIDGNYLLHK